MFNFGAAAGARLRLILAVLLMILPAAALAQEAAAPDDVPAAADSGLPSILAVRVTTTTQRARLILDLTGKTEFATVSLDQPNRIAVDVKAISVQFDQAPPVAGTGIVSSYTIEIAQEGRARATLNLAQPAMIQQAYVLDPVADQPARLVIDLVLSTPVDFANQVADDYAAALARTPSPTDVAPPPVVPGAVAASKPLVVIDPGHGGVDNGASAPNGVHEKDIVLAFALQLQQALDASGKFDVALTRQDDTFLRLDERVTLARQNKADLFISLHADTFQQSDIRGASVYTRDERATDVLDKVLADNENKVDIVAGFAMPNTPPVVVDILLDLMRRQMRKQSYIAAETIVKNLEPTVELRRFPVRQADFFVLQAPDVPSILIELGFLSNPADISNLQKNEWRDRVVTALSAGISSYFDGLGENVTTAAKP